MRVLALYTFILVIMSAVSCSKSDIYKPKDNIVGDYDWILTIFDDTNGFSSFETKTRYGLRIKSNGNMYLFNDKKIYKKGYLIMQKAGPNGIHKMTFFIDGFNYDFDFFNGVLYSKNWPFHGSNQFNKFK